MKTEFNTRQLAQISIAYDEVYTILQCVADAIDRLCDDDVKTIIGTEKTRLRELAVELNKLKIDMELAAP